MPKVLIIDSSNYKPTVSYVAEDDTAFFDVVKEYLLNAADGSTSHYNSIIAKFLNCCGTVDELNEINMIFFDHLHIKITMLDASSL